MEHESSILFDPVNRYIWHHAFGVDLPDHVIMAFLVFVISCIVFPLATRRLSKDNPGPFQQILEAIVSALKDLMEDIMGMLPLVIPWPMMGLGIFGAFLQTFVFIMLTMVYISGAVAVEEH